MAAEADHRKQVGVVNSTPMDALRAILGIRPLSKSISVQVAKTFCRIEHAHELGLEKTSGLRDVRFERLLRMSSDKILQIITRMDSGEFRFCGIAEVRTRLIPYDYEALLTKGP